MKPIGWDSALLLFGVCALAESVSAQGPTVVAGGGFVPGGQVLFATDFTQVPIGNFPSGLKYLRGPMEVVLVDGVPMLRASGPAEFIIPLAAALPQDFTLEFDLVARNSNCCAGEELAFEASPQLNRSAGSAWVSWHHQGTGIIGGGQNLGTSTVRFPEDLQGELIGQRAQIQVIVSGTQFKLYTNGRQIYNIPDLVFRRTNLLRVFLGGVDDAAGAVYLARVRLATGGGGVGAVAANPAAGSAPAPPPASLSPRTAAAAAASTGITAQPTVTAAGSGVPQSTVTAAGRTGPATSAGPGAVSAGTTSAAGTPTTVTTTSAGSTSTPALLPATGPTATTTPLSLAPTGVSLVPVGTEDVKVSFVAVGPPGMPNPAAPTAFLDGYIVERVPAGKASDCPADDTNLFFDNGIDGCVRSMARADVNPRWFFAESGTSYLVRVAAVFRSPTTLKAYWSAQNSVTLPLAPPSGGLPRAPRVILISNLTFVVGTRYPCPDYVWDSCAAVTVSWLPTTNAVSYIVQFDEFTGAVFYPNVLIDHGRESVAASLSPSLIKPIRIDRDGMVLRVCVAPVFDPALPPPDPRVGACSQAVVQP